MAPSGWRTATMQEVGVGRPIHVVCAPKDEYLAVITAYVPDPWQWLPDLRWRGP